MIHGLDTSFIVAAEVVDHPGHAAARERLDRVLAKADGLALAPQVLAELVHVVTDGRRFANPLTVAAARDRAERWWNAKEVVPAFPDEHTTPVFLSWHREHELGRKRLLDTLLAATYFTNGVRSILTTDARDFRVFGHFAIVET